MKRFMLWFLPLVVLAASLAVAQHLLSTAPEAKRKPPKPVIPVVETLRAQPVDYQVVVQSRGIIAPRTQGALVAEVAGRILEIAPNFRPGGFFEAGESLLLLDSSDYQHARTIAKAELVQADVALQEELAKGEQAKQEWQNLGLDGPAGKLTLRLPQQQRAKAALVAAQARLAQTQRDLQRTRIVAPYAGRVLEKKVDVGQFIVRGSAVATLYAVDYAEVRLPISDRQAAFLTLPERFRHDSSKPVGPPVTLTATIRGHSYEWLAQVVRTEGTLDARTRQIHLVAQVQDPYGRGPQGRPPLKVGQFVTAAIQGHNLMHVFLVPRSALRAEKKILTLTAENRIQHRALHPVWRDADDLVVLAGLQVGEPIVLTALPYAPDGMLVDVAGQKNSQSTHSSQSTQHVK